MPEAPGATQPDYDAALAEIEAAYPGINDDGSCPHGNRYDACPTCAPPQPAKHPHPDEFWPEERAAFEAALRQRRMSEPKP